uniref:Uncharacterized protein n=1 Tax=Rhizophora mucronata TaxID=61149 RepID=A0A2P2NUI6_RHIMU
MFHNNVFVAIKFKKLYVFLSIKHVAHAKFFY